AAPLRLEIEMHGSGPLQSGGTEAQVHAVIGDAPFVRFRYDRVDFELVDEAPTEHERDGVAARDRLVDMDGDIRRREMAMETLVFDTYRPAAHLRAAERAGA